jgi:hypothetical protein
VEANQGKNHTRRYVGCILRELNSSLVLQGEIVVGDVGRTQTRICSKPVASEKFCDYVKMGIQNNDLHFQCLVRCCRWGRTKLTKGFRKC